MSKAVLFRVTTPGGFSVTCTRSYWEFIAKYKHPVIAGCENQVRETLTDPDEIRCSRKDSQVFLFYRGSKPRWLCAVARRNNGEGFLITAYPTDAIKAGVQIWKR